MSLILLIFIKNPRLGRVKTRLARTVGATRALQIYRQLLEHTRLAALAVQAERWVYYSEQVEAQDIWEDTVFRKFSQSGSDLGYRMASAFADAFRTGATRAVIIGSDCPELSGSFLESAFSALEEVDFVLGPAADGGYYLLGMNTPAPWIFEDIRWSTASVLAHTLKKIQAAGMTYTLLPELSDIDTEADWLRFVGRN
ncbi:MAG: glycosyltransferase [Bacteroidetes bacterium]|nr:MAG: glycosyltransferase [Bacteroidota bacterium]